MKSLVAPIGLGAALALAAGCTSRPLQPDAGGSGGRGTIGIDAGSTVDGGAAVDGPLFHGRRSFVVTSTVTQIPNPDGGPPDGALSHVFTMVIDGDAWTAIAGAGPYPYFLLLEPAPGGFRVVTQPGFSLGPTAGAASYSDLTFRFDPAGRLLGNGTGKLIPFCGDARTAAPITMSLTGVEDTVAPTIAIVPAGDMTNPFDSFRVLASEPLPVEVQPVLRAAGGDVVALTPSIFPDEDFVALFYKPAILLRYGETYRLDLSGVRDFAGNAAIGSTPDSLEFTTGPLPPLVAPDGFESVTSETLGGAQVLSGTGDPIISGSRSLYVPPASALGAAPWTTRFALRLAVAPGNTVLRFTFREVNSNGLTTSELLFASVGGRVAYVVASSPSGNGTKVTIGGTEVWLSPIGTASIALPPDASGEIVVAGMTDATYLCNTLKPQELSGLIIDDLRVE